MQQNAFPVLVVGAGPVGLTMASELARHGVRCRLIDQLPAPSQYCRAIGVTPRTLEVWDNMGIVQQMIDAGLWLTGMRLITGDSEHKDLMLDLSDLPYSNLGLPQYETERILGEHLAQLGIPIERAVTLVSLLQDNNTVNVMLERADGYREESEFRYVVGCDGAHSTVRKALDISFEGDRFPMDFMLGDVHIDWDLPRGVALRVVYPRENQAPDMFIAIPLPERNRYRVSMLAPDAPAERPAASIQHGIQSEIPGPPLSVLQEVADRLVPAKPRLSDLRWSSIFRISMRLAQQYRKGNAFIAGDAAHIHPPTGGQGMNTGIQDAYNLAWKMALVVRGQASPLLLDSYEEERRPVGADVVARTREQSEKIGRVEAQRNRLADTQVLVNYRRSKRVKDESVDQLPDAALRAGDRSPDCSGLVTDHVHYPWRMFDLLRGPRFVLVSYYADSITAEEVHALESVASELRNAYGSLFKVVAMLNTPGDTPVIVGVSVFRDTERRFAAAYAAKARACYLIRPDGYIGYHATSFTKAGLLGYLRELGMQPEG